MHTYKRMIKEAHAEADTKATSIRDAQKARRTRPQFRDDEQVVTASRPAPPARPPRRRRRLTFPQQRFQLVADLGYPGEQSVQIVFRCPCAESRCKSVSCGHAHMIGWESNSHGVLAVGLLGL